MNNIISHGYMNGKQAATYIGMKPRNLAIWRKAGIVKFVKCGKAYFYRREWLDEVMNRFIGYDISNPDSIALAIEEIARKKLK